MKLSINYRMTAVITMLFVSLLTGSGCNNDKDKKCCEGYTGSIENANAKKLVEGCHYISQETIEEWVARYKRYNGDKEGKDTLGTNPVSKQAEFNEESALFLKGSSISFNSCIIKKLICNENSIGLRVLYGMDEKNKIHTILVGIQKDYSNLFVKAEEECCKKSVNKNMANGLSGLTATGLGGAQYGQMP
jgi:hypothetical protein